MTSGERNLELLGGRRSVRRFAPDLVPRAQVLRLLAAAQTAPSSTNRQPWRFAVVTGGARRRLAEVVAACACRLAESIARSPHAAELAGYGDFFHEPLAAAPLVIVPAFRTYPDSIASFLRSAGEDPRAYTTPAAMDMERCATSAAVMALLIQAHAEGLGACWMAGPTIARAEVEAMVGIAEPYRMLGAIAIGRPLERPTAPVRRPLEDVVTWIGEEHEP